MIHRPVLYRHMDDDNAPVDYSYVPSVSEGRRRQQAQNIKHSEPQSAVVRHRADPFEREAVDEYGTRARHTPEDKAPRPAVRQKLPSLADGPAPAARVAYPEDYGIPDNPFNPPPEEPGPAAGTGAGTAPPPRPAAPEALEQPPALVAEDGSQYDPPVAPPMPEWLRVAQQNSMPPDDRRRRAPRVQAAPRHEAEAEPQLDLLGRPMHAGAASRQPRPDVAPPMAEEYQRAGYPPELLAQQELLDRQQAEQGRRRRHGAQYAVNQYRQQEYEQSVGAHAFGQASYPPPREAGDQRRAAPGADPRTTVNGGRMLPPEAPPMERAAAYSAAVPEQPPYVHRPRYAAAAPAVGERPSSVGAYDGPGGFEDGLYPVEDSAWQDEKTDRMPMYEERPRIPWLGISVFAAAFIAVGLWLLQLAFTSQTDQVLRARQESHEALLNSHPYRYEELIEREAQRNNLHPAFVAAIVLNESSFNPKAESGVGARGLMQLMNDTAAFVYQKKSGSEGGFDFDALYEAETNVEYGCWYLAYLSERFRSDPVLVAAAYHAGPNEVQNWLNDSRYSADNLTLELSNMIDGPTKQYATRVLRDYAVYKRLYYQSTEDDA